MRILACMDETPASDGTCAVQAWVEQPSLLPPMTTDEATEIGTAALVAFVAVMVVKVVMKKSH